MIEKWAFHPFDEAWTVGTETLGRGRKRSARVSMPLCGGWGLDLSVGAGLGEGCNDLMQDTLPERIKRGAPVSRTFDELHTTELPD